ncbi:MAG TPA: T9SS type A sorting domain-containing protein [Chitinophagaceae bacterium]|nr:T9SS type A sorting domain-containing protein [Chitinophagaceae bacterium]
MLVLSAGLSFGQAPDYPPAPPGRTVVRAEYYFDTDPGLGNGTPITIVPGTNITTSATVNLNGSALTNGFHRLYIRTQDDAGRWSLTASALFNNVVIVNYPSAPAPASPIVDVEYYIDTDPGFGNGKKITVPEQTNLNSFNALVDISGITPGAHRLFIRSKNAAGKWSLSYYTVFDNAALVPYPSAPAPAPPLGEAEYYFDTDPGFGNGTPITLPASTNVQDFSLSIPIGSLSEGPHTIYIRSKQNPWSFSAYAEFLYGRMLPVSWLYVKAEAREKDAFITWATAAEQNAAKFIVEASRDGSSYTAVGEVAAKNSANGSSYSFRHANAGNGTVYYRIRQVDADGKFSYSKIVWLLFRDGIRQPVLFPNPATSVVHVYMPQGTTADVAEVYDAGGRFIKRISPVTGSSTVSVPVTDLPSGRYVLTLIKGKERTSYNFVKN